MGHAFLAPSAAGCTVNCAAAPLLQSQCPEDEDAEKAREGTAAHWVMAQTFTGGAWPTPGDVAPNGIVIDAAMIEAAEMVYDDVTDTLGPHSAVPRIEETLPCPLLHPDKNGGTPDAWGYYEDAGTWFIHLWDFKYGHGIHEVFEHWQLINYAACTLTALHLEQYDDSRIYFTFTIVQPRAYHMDGPVRRWIVKASELRGHFNRLRDMYARATRPDPPATPGPWCGDNYCTAAGRGCDALARAASHVIQRAYKPLRHDMSAADLGLALHIAEDAKKMLDAHVDGMRGQALAMLNRGAAVPYYTVDFGKGREVIPDEKVPEFIAVGEALGVDVAKPRQAITPKQARLRGVPGDVVAMYAVQRSGEKKLIPDDGTRARQTFGLRISY